MRLRMTRQRRAVIDKMAQSALMWGFTGHGGREYYFADGTPVSATVVEGLIDADVLCHSASPLGGHGQELMRRDINAKSG